MRYLSYRNYENVSLIFAIALAFWCLSTSIGYVIETFTPLPFWDQWDYALPQDVVAKFFDFHNEHLPVFTRLGFLIDLEFFRGTNAFSLTIVMLIQIAHILMLGIISALETGRRIDLIATAVSAVFLLSLYQSMNFTSAFQTAFVGVFVFSTASFLVFVQGRPTLRNTSAASAIAFVASFTLANGVLTFPILLIMSFILGRPKKHVALISVIALIAVSILWRGSSKGLTVNFESLPSIASYILTYLGAPISKALTIGDPKIFGLVAVILSLAMILPKLVHRVGIYKSDLILSGIVVFVIGTAVTTALGRYQSVGAAGTSRYATPVLLLWCCFLLWVYLLVSRRSELMRGFATGAVLLIGLGFQIASLSFIERSDAAMGRRYAAETALLSGIPDHEALLETFTPKRESLVLKKSDALKRSNLSIFAQPWSEWLGAPIHVKSNVIDPRRCAGRMEDVERVVSDNHIFIRASGWAWDLSSNHALRKIVLVDQNDKVIGFGRGPFAHRQATPTTAQIGELGRAFWRGHGTIDKPTTVSAYALIGDGKFVCHPYSSFFWLSLHRFRPPAKLSLPYSVEPPCLTAMAMRSPLCSSIARR